MRNYFWKRFCGFCVMVAILLSMMPTTALATETFDTENFVGLVLTAVDGVSVKLYKGYSTADANLITPDYSEGNTH